MYRYEAYAQKLIHDIKERLVLYASVLLTRSHITSQSPLLLEYIKFSARCIDLRDRRWSWGLSDGRNTIVRGGSSTFSLPFREDRFQGCIDFALSVPRLRVYL
jgi:hypothetical protein